MLSNSPYILKTVCKYTKRNFYEWLNIIFNKVDEDRRKRFGVDRTCAEWLLRNGAAVRWISSSDYISDYNSLPIEGTQIFIKEVDATGSSIMHYGFKHFVGCKHIDTLILNECGYLEDEALSMLDPLNGSLKKLQVSTCGNITQAGLMGLAQLGNLQTLCLTRLRAVKDLDKVIAELKLKLPNCNITKDDLTKND